MAPSEPLCVYCRRQPTDPAFRPFCSARCRMADLGRWLSEDYRVPEADAPAWSDDAPVDRQPEHGAPHDDD